MGIAEILDGAIAPIAPGWAAQRMSDRARLEAARAAMTGIRRYEAAENNRRNKGWHRVDSSADGENQRAQPQLAWAGHDLARNNKYVAGGVRQMVATIIGDGISAQINHPVKRIRDIAQGEFNRFVESKVDGFGDWYGHQKVSCREMILGGEAFTLWKPDEAGPDGRIVGIEGPQVDFLKTVPLANDARIVQGVEFDGEGNRAAYWIYDAHPNDLVRPMRTQSHRVPAAEVDHLFERLRFNQTRGVSHLAPLAMTLRDIHDIEDAKRWQEKVQACLALIITPPEGRSTSPLGEQAADSRDGTGTRPLGETIRPGMIARVGAGETINTVNPQPSPNTVEFIRQQIAAVSASMVPYHLMTGDVSQANYSSLRAAMNGLYSMVDDWQQNEIIPLLCRPALARRMRRLAIERGDARFLQVTATWALPIRRMVDPIKDLLGEVMEIRAGLKLLSHALAERGANTETHMADIQKMNILIDQLGLALDTDPRRLTDAGVLQVAAGYIAPKATDQSAA